MSAQKNVPGAGTTERQKDWTITSLLKDLAETGSYHDARKPLQARRRTVSRSFGELQASRHPSPSTGLRL